FEVKVDQFADVQILRYEILGFEDLTPKQKELVYYLYQAALSGRDIIYDKNYKHNLVIRRTLKVIVNNYSGDKTTEAHEQFMTYVARVWFSNGIQHHYSAQHIAPAFSSAYFPDLFNIVHEDKLP